MYEGDGWKGEGEYVIRGRMGIWDGKGVSFERFSLISITYLSSVRGEH